MSNNTAFQPCGLYPAIVTPMRPDASLALERLPALVALLRAQGVDGLFVAGTTGEGRQLREQERCDLLEAVAACAGDLPLIAHVGHDSILAAADLAAHAAKIGVKAIALSPPCYRTVTRLEELVACYQPVLRAAPDTPAFHYHIPALTRCTVAPSCLLTVAGEELPSLCGVKFTDANLMELQRCRRVDGGRFHIGFGRDEQMLSALPYGIDWFIGSTFNIAAPMYQALLAAWHGQDLPAARRLQDRAIALVDVMQRHGGLAVIKCALAELGCDCGPCRPPLSTLDDRSRAMVINELATLELFSMQGVEA